VIVGYNGATIRDEESVDSKFITKLPRGTLVLVDEIKDRRVHIVSPVKGWTSMHTTSATPLVILQPLDSDE
jgi:hypothetical protein